METADNEINEVVKQIEAEYGELELRFAECCHRIVSIIDAEREAQRRNSYDHDQKVIFVYEMYRTMMKYKDEVRKDGSSTFYSHLVGAVENLIRDSGLTGIVSVLATLKHDWVEDFVGKEATQIQRKTQERVLRDEVVDPSMYRDKLERYDAAREAEICKEIRDLVMGVTKLRRKSPRGGEEKVEETMEATFQRFLRVVSRLLRLAAIKCADRSHNLSTLDGHGSDEKARNKKAKIIRETENLYMPLAMIFGLRASYRNMALACLEFANPLLLKRFEEIKERRLKERLDKFKEHILKQFDDFSTDVEVKVQFLPKELPSFIARVDDKQIAEMRVQDLKLSSMDPMFEILVTTNVNDCDDLDQEWAAMVDMKSFIERKFASSPGSKSTGKIPSEKDVKRVRGLKLTVFNKDFGGRLYFRINNRIAEARSKRGILAIDNETPKEMREMIEAIVNNTTSRVRGVSGRLAAASTELLKPRMRVYTRGGDELDLPVGAIGMDFAAAIHPDLLIGLQGIAAKKDLLSRECEKPISPFDRLEEGAVYIVDSCLNREAPDRSKIQVLPEWILFCQSRAGAAIRKYFRKFSDEECVGFGEDYLSRVSDLFKVDRDFLYKLLEVRYRNRSREAIFKGMVVEDINPLLLLAENMEKRQKKLKKSQVENKGVNLCEIAVDLPDAPGEYHEFIKEFASKDDGINICNLGEVSRYKPGRACVRMTLDLSKMKITIYDFLKKLLKLNFKYSIVDFKYGALENGATDRI